MAFVTGPADAKTSLVEFYDYDCPFCRASLPAVKKFYDAHKSDTRFSFIEFPIADLHGPSALLAARASLAARRQPEQYLDFHFTLLNEEGLVTRTDDLCRCRQGRPGRGQAQGRHGRSGDRRSARPPSIALAHKVGVDGTPTFVSTANLHRRRGQDDDLTDLAKDKPV